jgi:hypothetical protein
LAGGASKCPGGGPTYSKTYKDPLSPYVPILLIGIVTGTGGFIALAELDAALAAAAEDEAATTLDFDPTAPHLHRR